MSKYPSEENDSQGLGSVVTFHKLIQSSLMAYDSYKNGPVLLKDNSNQFVKNHNFGFDLPRPNDNDITRQIPFDLLLDWEAIFEHDLRDVKIHTGAYADELTKSFGAQALTVGNNIYFTAGKYSPDTEEGKGLFGHELMHVVQKDLGKPMRYFEDIEKLEQEAEVVERNVSGREVDGENVDIDPSTITLEELSDRNTKKGYFILLASGEEVFLTRKEYECVVEEAVKYLKQYYAGLTTVQERLNFMKAMKGI